MIMDPIEGCIMYIYLFEILNFIVFSNFVLFCFNINMAWVFSYNLFIFFTYTSIQKP